MGIQALRADQTISASTPIAATPQQVYDIVSDIGRIPEWSPECVSADWIDADTFRGKNARRLGRWSTKCKVVANDPGREFTFEVQLPWGGAFTRWSYQIQPDGDGSVLTEVFTMCRDLAWYLLAFEVVALGVTDRTSDLQGNLDQSVQTIRRIAEKENQR